MPDVDVIRENNGQFGGSRGHGTSSAKGARKSGGGKNGASSPKMAEVEAAPSQKSMLAKQSAKHVGAEIQRYAEEHNEPVAAKALGGKAMRDNEAEDIRISHDGKITHGVELKTIVDNGNNKITQKGSAMERKAAFMAEHHVPFHTVVFDDTHVFNANGPGKHDDSKRVIYYRRGFGSFRLDNMHIAKDMDEVNLLLATKDSDLPKAAQPSRNYISPIS